MTFGDISTTKSETQAADNKTGCNQANYNKK